MEHVGRDPYFQLFSVHDREKVKQQVKDYMYKLYNVHISLGNEMVDKELTESQKYIQPMTGDIYTRCILDDFAPDQFYGRHTILQQIVCQIIQNIEYDLYLNDDHFNAWNVLFAPKTNDIKIQNFKPLGSITLKY